VRPVRVVFADDHPLVREGLGRLLAGLPGVEVAGEAADGAGALSKVKSVRPDLLLLDIEMPGMGGLETIRLVREASPATEVIVVSMYSAESFVHEALRAGAKGYVVKGESTEALIAAIRTVGDGRTYLSPGIDPGVTDRFAACRPDGPIPTEYDRLSEREKQVFHLVVAGNTTQRIAELLFISPKTVEKHRSAVTQKLGIANHTELIKFAIRSGLLDPGFWKA